MIHTLPTKTDRESASSLFAWEAAELAGSAKQIQSRSWKIIMIQLYLDSSHMIW